MSRRKTTLAVSIGCPAGIGPEVSVAAAAKTRGARCLLVGDPEVVRRAARIVGVDHARLHDTATRDELEALPPGAIGVYPPSLRCGETRFGRPDRRAGRAQLGWVDQALDLVTSGGADALVTGPVSKHAIAAAGSPRFRGHTEHLAERTGTTEVFMAFWHRRFTAALVTTHLSIARVPRAIDAGVVTRCTVALADFVARAYGGPARIVVMGLNPHAGEEGLIGDEEIRAIRPGVKAAARILARRNVGVEGPVGGETVARWAQAGKLRGMVAMYHDQATIPMKLLTFGEAVNVTLGLPIIRTSVDHGTGYDIAGTGKADAAGMVQAMRLGAGLAQAPAALTRGRASRSRS